MRKSIPMLGVKAINGPNRGEIIALPTHMKLGDHFEILRRPVIEPFAPLVDVYDLYQVEMNDGGYKVARHLKTRRMKARI
jgi:hypothetical protein